MIYLDNAATSWPKPAQVTQAMVKFLNEVGANPGRSGHRMSVEAARIVYQAREACAEIFNAPDPLRVIFTANATEALNLVLYGLLRPGDHVITSSMEHNAVMRPLRHLARQGIHLTVVPCANDGTLQATQVEAAIQDNTVLVVMTHASNVSGTLLPIRQVGEITSRRGILLLSDEAQSAGAYPVDLQEDHIDLLAFTGHKSLYGPTGTGGLILGPRVEAYRIDPLRRGGTGSRSETEEQPEFLPDKFECGTINAVGLAGLLASLHWVKEQSVEAICNHERNLCNRLLIGMADMPGVNLYGIEDTLRRTAVISFNITGVEPSEIGLRLDEEYGILCRVGLHCAPAAHRTIRTFPSGTVRFSLGAFNTVEQVDHALQATDQLARSYKK